MIRRILAGLLTALLAAGIGFLSAGPAAAHSAPVASEPADGASIDAGPARVSVTFNENLQPSFPSLTVVGPDGNRWDKGEPAVDGPTVSVPVGELGPAGRYTVAYRVTSADGHPVSGTRTFTLTKPGTGTPGAKAGASSGSGGGEDSGGVPVWVFIVGAVVLFGGGLAVALLGGKKSRKRS
ncbi:copper resistance protein CopC [Nocardia sp. CDC159]|uniref:Copper resistance protein CopC n=1 Tax=Nocardia pulmonis TaxID=2951408 RepID=A0A9X2EAY6_9NOCA|nr:MULTISPECIES: copper resistance CopC family protein [Nocardia]MCM6776916.1 copper resistance protein CopC [Nocardia pulmonis]MCM6789340.1 copper resistance protein CopC [Nocardia sp. CDC159]